MNFGETINVFYFILVYFELIMNDIPVPNIHHSIFAIILGFIYNIFLWTIIAIFQRPFPYPHLDYNEAINGVVIIGVTFILFICWLIGFGFKRFIVDGYIRNKGVEYEEIMLGTRS
eukprot:302733_1